jgi:hypothetical protein
MRYLPFKVDHVGVAVAVVVTIIGGCIHAPIVVSKSSCTVFWDAVGDPTVKEYQVKIWPNGGIPEPKDVVYPVDATKTSASCVEAGARTSGSWLVSVRACRNKKSTEENNCSAPAGPLAFTIVDR